MTGVCWASSNYGNSYQLNAWSRIAHSVDKIWALHLWNPTNLRLSHITAYVRAKKHKEKHKEE